ncbi:MAG: hypothetical protein JW741_17240 [Sedimentisphaerales bacterium]|nr:hypothetical protein [Sedimentisphaerales bacterium]
MQEKEEPVAPRDIPVRHARVASASLSPNRTTEKEFRHLCRRVFGLCRRYGSVGGIQIERFSEATQTKYDFWIVGDKWFENQNFVRVEANPSRVKAALLRDVAAAMQYYQTWSIHFAVTCGLICVQHTTVVVEGAFLDSCSSLAALERACSEAAMLQDVGEKESEFRRSERRRRVSKLLREAYEATRRANMAIHVIAAFGGDPWIFSGVSVWAMLRSARSMIEADKIQSDPDHVTLSSYWVTPDGKMNDYADAGRKRDAEAVLLEEWGLVDSDGNGLNAVPILTINDGSHSAEVRPIDLMLER